MTADPRSPEATDGSVSAGAHRLPGGGLFARGRTPGPTDDPTTELPAAYEQLGPYRLIEKLGEGGMGVVHKALDRDGREVAIKVLRPHIAHDQGARDRLRREVSTLARVRDARVAPVLDADVDGERPYLVTAYVPGPPLDDVIEDEGPLSPQQLVRLGRGLAEALGAIHAAGVVHRDLKPGNVLMVGDDPILIDFGIAHVADDVRLTMTGLVMGTPGYLSPEVVEGAAVTESTDWWGWAATLAFAASGQAPFGRGPMPVVLDRVTRGEADLSGVDERLRPLLASALSPVPGRRPSAERVLAELQEYAAGGHTTGIPVRSSGTDSAARGIGRPATEPVGQPAVASVTRQTPRVVDTQRQPVHRPDATEVLARPGASAAGAPLAVGQPSGTSPSTATYPGAPGTQADRWQAGQGQGAGPVPPGQWERRETDPRIGQAARSWTLIALLAADIGITALWPLAGVTVLVLWSIGARWLDRAMTAMVLRRYEGGRRRSDGFVAAISSPWHALRAVLATLLALLVPVFVGACAAVTTALAVSMLKGDSPRLGRALPIAVGVLIGAWVLWWGPGGTSMRRGSRSIVRAVVRGEPLTQVVVALAVVITVICAGWSLSHHGQISWWPMQVTNDWSLSRYIPQLPGR